MYKTERIEKLLEKARKVHGDKYNYDKSTLITYKDKTIITCPIHGDFVQTWDNHINNKSGCPKCVKCHKYNNEEWIEEVTKKFNGKYDYSKTNYTKAKEKVIVICHEKDELGEEHGEFQIRAGNHMAGIGCPKCAGKYKPTTEEWIKRANYVHKNKYDYSKTKYTKSSEKVCIICHEKDEFGEEHGEFWQEATSHLMGCGCSKCNGGTSFSKNEFVKKAKEVHKTVYDYSKFEYTNANTKSVIICPKHGEFLQSAWIHLKGHGCPKCKSSRLENIVMRMLEKQNINYTYQYNLKCKDTVLKCDFLLDDYNIIIECQGEQHFIPTNFSNNSETITDEDLARFEKQKLRDSEKYDTALNENKTVLYYTIPNDFHKNNVNVNEGFYKDKLVFTDIDRMLEYVKNSKKPIKNTHNTFNDFFKYVYNDISKNTVKSNNVIYYNEYVILYFSLKQNNKYDVYEKKRLYEKRGNKVIVVFEDEFLNKKDIVLKKLKHILLLNNNTEKIMARKCSLKEIDKNIAKEFLNNNHIQGFVSSTVYLGAFYGDKLISVMCFTKEENKKWNLTRFASDNDYICNGVGGKLFKYFIKNYDYTEIKSFSDRRWSYNETDNLYTKLGFVKSKVLSPDYHYIKNGDSNRYHKFSFRKNILIKKYPNIDLDPRLTELEMTKMLGYDRIWDCGLVKYIYYNQNYKIDINVME